MNYVREHFLSILFKYPKDKKRSLEHSYDEGMLSKFLIDRDVDGIYNSHAKDRSFSKHWWGYVLALTCKIFSNRMDGDENILINVLTEIFNKFKKDEFIDNHVLIYNIFDIISRYYDKSEEQYKYAWFYKNCENGFVLTKQFIDNAKPKFFHIHLTLTNINSTKKRKGWESKYMINLLYNSCRDYTFNLFVNKYIINKNNNNNNNKDIDIDNVKLFLQYSENYFINIKSPREGICSLVNLMIERNTFSNIICIKYFYDYARSIIYNYYSYHDYINDAGINKIVDYLSKNSDFKLDFSILDKYPLFKQFKFEILNCAIKKNITYFVPFSNNIILSLYSDFNKLPKCARKIENSQICTIKSIKFLTKKDDLENTFIAQLIVLSIDSLNEDLVGILKSDSKYLTENLFQNSIIADNSIIVEYFLSNKFQIEHKHFCLCNSIKMLGSFKKYNFYLDFESYFKLIRIKQFTLEELKPYSIYADDDEEFNKIKNKLEYCELEKLIQKESSYDIIKLIEYLELNKPNINIETIIYLSNNSNKQILYNYMNNTNYQKDVNSKKLIKK